MSIKVLCKLMEERLRKWEVKDKARYETQISDSGLLQIGHFGNIAEEGDITVYRRDWKSQLPPFELHYYCYSKDANMSCPLCCTCTSCALRTSTTSPLCIYQVCVLLPGQALPKQYSFPTTCMDPWPAGCSLQIRT